MSPTRRTVIAGLSVIPGLRGKPISRPWKPRGGILANFHPANLRFAAEQGFTSIGLFADRKTFLDATKPLPDSTIEQVKSALKESGLFLSVIGAYQINHTAPDREERTQNNQYFKNVIELAGRLGAPYVGTGSGKMPGQPLPDQVAAIERVYNEHYFPVCERNRIRILWEPWAGGPNVATGPVPYEALFNAFGPSPYVGLQFDPSHLVWQMMDPIQAAQDFADKIYDVHLKDTEIRWPILQKVGINPWENEEWWRFRVPGSGCIDWRAFFGVLMDKGYQGAMNIEHEDDLYGTPYSNGEFTANFQNGFIVAKNYLRQFLVW